MDTDSRGSTSLSTGSVIQNTPPRFDSLPSTTSPDPPASNADGFRFPQYHSFPPFYTLQPNVTTLARQMDLWSAVIQSYCAHRKLFRLSLSSEANSPLFHNSSLNRRLDLLSIRRVIDHMCSAEGDRRAEWITSSKKQRTPETKTTAWIYWKRPEEWADMIYNWVDDTGQKGSVLTVYELRESDAVQKQEWVGMEEDLFRRCLDVLTSRGKAQVFGADEGAGVKFF